MSTGADRPVVAGPSTPVTLRVPHERTGVRLARHALADQMDAAGISGVERDDAILVLSELVATPSSTPPRSRRVRSPCAGPSAPTRCTSRSPTAAPRPCRRPGIAALLRVGRPRAGHRAHDLPPWGVTEGERAVTVWADVPRPAIGRRRSAAN